MIVDRFAFPGAEATDHRLEVPLDPGRPDGPTLSLFARELAAPGAPPDRPALLYLQGGPGSPAPRPEAVDGWIERALREFRVVLMDQRGTGLSTPATAQTLAALPDAQAQAAYLSHFRADAIVADAERLRHELLGPERPWSVLGQSFGGFCALRYLSAAPEGVREAFLTGGLAPLVADADTVYRATYRRLAHRNDAYLRRYPGDEAGWTAVAEHLRTHDERLPNGDPLTVEGLQYLGMLLGSERGFETLHYLLEGAFVRVGGAMELSDAFREAVAARLSFTATPLFALVHEAIYAQEGATEWAAWRVLDEAPGVRYRPGGPLRFTGEMIYPWMFDQVAALRPLKGAAELLARRASWPRLYDLERLAANTVPVAAAVYLDDMYVDAELSLDTADRVGAVRTWVTNRYQHDGLRRDGAAVLDRLIAMARGEA